MVLLGFGPPSVREPKANRNENEAEGWMNNQIIYHLQSQLGGAAYRTGALT